MERSVKAIHRWENINILTLIKKKDISQVCLYASLHVLFTVTKITVSLSPCVVERMLAETHGNIVMLLHVMQTRFFFDCKIRRCDKI